MENKLFENAKFGDKFVTRDGRNALYLSKDEYALLFAVEGCDSIVACHHDGTTEMYPCESDYDIVSRYVEPIDEDELDRLAEQSEKEQIRTAKQCEALGQCYGFDFQTGFKAGYRRAKEE